MDHPQTRTAVVSDHATIEQRRRARRASRLVLLGLAAPLIGLAAVLFLLLPGGVGGITYLPSQYSQAVQIQPATWTSRVVSIGGYLDRLCTIPQPGTSCSAWVLLDQPHTRPVTAREAIAMGGLQVLPQQDSAVYIFFQHFVPGLSPSFPRGLSPGDRATVTGTVQVIRAADGLPVFAPKTR